MSEPEKSTREEPKKLPPALMTHQARQDKLKQIQALYRSQIKQIYNDSKEKVEVKEKPAEKVADKPTGDKLDSLRGIKKAQSPILSPSATEKTIQNTKSVSTLNVVSPSGSKVFGGEQQRVRASVFLKGESTRTIEVLRKQNQMKELKIRQLTNRCQQLIEKLRAHLQPGEVQAALQSVREFSDGKMQRLQNLFKIKNEQIFFKIKLQVIALLQQFQVGKQQISEINEVSSESALFSFMVRKLKLKLKNFRSKQQESNFQIQKDKILNQKYQQRIHYLMETTQLLKLSQGKLKNKVEDLKGQLGQFIEKLKNRERENQERESQVFRLRRQNQELAGSNQRLSQAVKGANSQKVDERRIYQAKEKEMKMLLNNYFLEKKKLEGELEEKQGQIQEILIKQRFLQQENQRINREYVRWKQRYEWLEREKETKIRQFQQQKQQLLAQFEDYKIQNNQGLIMGCKSDIDQALRKVEQYQIAYQRVLAELEDERRLVQRVEDQAQEETERMERQWLEKVRRIQKLKQEQLYEIASENEARQAEIREEFQKKEKLLAEEMQARMKALLAEKDKKQTEQLIHLESENDDLRREIDNLHKILDVKESLINVINSKKLAYE